MSVMGGRTAGDRRGAEVAPEPASENLPEQGAEPGAADRVDGRDARWAAHRSTRRAELVRGSRRAVHRQGPDLSMDDLAAEIGTSKSILYRYFSDKVGLQGAVGGAVLHDLRESLAHAGEEVSRPRERLAAMVGVYLQMLESSANVYAFVTRPEAAAAAGQLRGFVAEIEDIVAEALLPVLLPEGTTPDPPQLALAATWAAGVVGLVRGSAERWVAARQDPQPSAPDGDVEQMVASLGRDELTEQITTWLWHGAGGIARRARSAGGRP